MLFNRANNIAQVDQLEKMAEELSASQEEVVKSRLSEVTSKRDQLRREAKDRTAKLGMSKALQKWVTLLLINFIIINKLCYYIIIDKVYNSNYQELPSHHPGPRPDGQDCRLRHVQRYLHVSGHFFQFLIRMIIYIRKN